MEFYGYLVHPPAQFMENTNVALKIQTFLRISVQEKGGYEDDIILNSTNGKWTLMVETGGVSECHKSSWWGDC